MNRTNAQRAAAGAVALLTTVGLTLVLFLLGRSH
jgi:hypothetical protein